jgi:Na+/H+ antiporter NhaB
MLAGALAQPNHQVSNNGLNGMVSEDVFVSYIYKSQKDNGLNLGIMNNQNTNKV